MGRSEHISRVSVAALDEVLGLAWPVLDQGFVRAVDYMGSDDAIVQAARVSYGQGTKKVREDRGLIRYLMRHHHTTPFEMCEIKLHVRVPMDCWRQWIRHRTANVNEYSTRYSVAIDAMQATPSDGWRTQSTINKQGSGANLVVELGKSLTNEEARLHRLLRETYENRLAAGVAREQARKDLPMSTYTEAYWKIDLHNLLHFVRLRMDFHAQKEIREYARVIGNEIVARWVPLAWEAFRDYRQESVIFSATEVELLSLITSGRDADALDQAESLGWVKSSGSDDLKVSRECAEFEAKLKRMSVVVPWRSQKH